MATIPNANQIERARIAPTETIQRIDTSFAGKKAAAYSNALGGLAEDALHRYDADAEFEATKANREMFKSYKTVLDEAEKDNGDYTKLVDTHAPKIKEAESKVVEGMKNSYGKKLFEEAQANEKLEFESKLEGIRWGKEVSTERKNLFDDLNMIKDSVSFENIQKVGGLIEDSFNTAVAKGYIAADEAAKELYSYRNQAAFAGIDLIPDLNKKKEVLEEKWAVDNLDAGKRAQVLEQTNKEIKDNNLKIISLDASSGKTLGEVIKKVNDAVVAGKIAPEDEGYARGLAVNNYTINKGIETEAQDKIYQYMGKGILAKPKMFDVYRNSKDWNTLSYQQQLSLKQDVERARAGPSSSDPITVQRAHKLIAQGRFGEAQEFIEANGSDGTGKIANADGESLLKSINEGSVPAQTEMTELLNTITTTPIKKEDKKLRARQAYSLTQWKNNYVAKNDRQPSEAELHEQALMVTRKYSAGWWDMYGEPNLNVADLEIEQQGKVIDNLKKDDLKIEYGDIFKMVKESFGEDFDEMSSYDVKDHIDMAVDNPVLYQDAIEVMKERGVTFEEAYGKLKKHRGL